MDGYGDLDYIDDTSNTDPHNFGAGRSSCIGALVHSTSGINSLSWLKVGAARNGSPASADWLIDRDGAKHHICKDGYYPYHAGRSALTHNGVLYQGNEISRYFIGVELECLDNERVTWQQELALAQVIVAEGLRWGWRWPYAIYGHYEVARPLGRRLDPQGLNWGALMGQLYVCAKVAGIPGLS